MPELIWSTILHLETLTEVQVGNLEQPFRELANGISPILLQ
jgi:hypothetical protein